MLFRSSDVLIKSVENTKSLLKRELEIAKEELLNSLHFASLEKIFIEERIYKDKEFEEAKSMDMACEHIDSRLEPFYPQFIREVSKDDILRLMEIKMGRILKFNTDKATEQLLKMEKEIADINKKLAHLVDYTIAWYDNIKEKYGKSFPRKTELRSFNKIGRASCRERV